MRARRGWRRARRAGTSETVATVFLIGLTIVAGVFLWTWVVPLPVVAPTIQYTAMGGLTYPVWGDPTDCWPVLPFPPSYYLGNGSHDARWNTYMNAWNSQCLNSGAGTYNSMNVSEIVFTHVSQPVPLASIQFNFICHNTTPAPLTTFLVRGSLAAMSWFPGASQVIDPGAPKLGSCGTFNASGFGGGAFSVYYNRLGFFKPIVAGESQLLPGSSFVLYIHTGNSVLEAPSPIEPPSTWNKADFDDYHGAPSWCFTTVDACTIVLVDTAISTQPVLATIPVFSLRQ